MLSIIRRMRTLEPTCLSIGLGDFFAIRVSYATIAKPNVIKAELNAMRVLTWRDTERRMRSKLIIHFSRFRIAEVTPRAPQWNRHAVIGRVALESGTGLQSKAESYLQTHPSSRDHD